MSKFKVDLTASDRPERFSEEGDYVVVIENVEKALTQQGFEKATITFKDGKNRAVKDDILNKDTVYWRLNQLIVATDMKVPHGTEYDFTKSGEFFNFVKTFVGMKLKINLKSEAYTNKDGEAKSILKVSKYIKSPTAGQSSDEPF
jgi:hypothetical protein